LLRHPCSLSTPKCAHLTLLPITFLISHHLHRIPPTYCETSVQIAQTTALHIAAIASYLIAA
jgi:hypothetical protein